MDEKKRLLLIEENKMESHTDLDSGNDALDAYMSGLSSQLGLVLRHKYRYLGVLFYKYWLFLFSSRAGVTFLFCYFHAHIDYA